MKLALNALTAAVILTFAASVSAAPETVVSVEAVEPAAPEPVITVEPVEPSAPAAPAAADPADQPTPVITVETVKDINQIPVSDQKPPVEEEKDPDEMVQALIYDYLGKKGITTDRDYKGKRFYSGVAIVNSNRSHPDFGKALSAAYLNAYMQALTSFGESRESRVVNEIERELFSDESTDAASFPDDPGKKKIDVLIDKGMQLAEAKLDEALRKLGTSEDKLRNLSLNEKKTLFKDAVRQKVQQATSFSLGGINIQQNFIASTGDGNAAVGVLVAYSQKMASVAYSLSRGEKPLIRAVGQPLSQLLPLNNPEKLAENYGARLMIDDQGPVIVAFGLWSSSYNGSDRRMAAQKRRVATRQADLDASAQIARFLSLSFTSLADSETGGSTQTDVRKDENTGNAGIQTTTDQIKDRLSDHNVARANARLTGVETLKQWSWRLPEGQQLVGVVKAYRFAGIENARKTFEPPVRPTQETQAPANESENNMKAFSGQGSVESNLDVF